MCKYKLSPSLGIGCSHFPASYSLQHIKRDKSLLKALIIRISRTAVLYPCINCNIDLLFKWYGYLHQYISYWQPIFHCILRMLQIIIVIDVDCIDPLNVFLITLLLEFYYNNILQLSSNTLNNNVKMFYEIEKY